MLLILLQSGTTNMEGINEANTQLSFAQNKCLLIYT